MENIIRRTNKEGQPLLAWQDYCTECGRTDCWGCKVNDDFETPQTELEQEPEYKHLLKTCAELGIEI